MQAHLPAPLLQLLPVPVQVPVLSDATAGCSSLSETLQMVVVLPFLWGVPPEHESLRYTHSCCTAALHITKIPQFLPACLEALTA